MIKRCFETLTPEGKINFTRIVIEYFEIIVKNVRLLKTKKEYISYYNNVILPVINLNMYVEDLTYEYVENLKSAIIKKHKYSGSTVDKIWMLLTKPINIYYEKMGKPNKSPFKNEDIDEGEQEKAEVFERFKKIIKSFSPAQEIEIVCYLFEHINEGGEIMGLAILFFFTIRENESCGTVFGSYKTMEHYKYCHYLDAGVTTTGINSNELKDSGKNGNSPREDVAMELFDCLYKKRKKFTIEQTGCVDIQSYPLVCKGNNFEHRCSTPDLSKAGKKLLQDVLHIKKEDYEDLDYLLKHSDVFDTEYKDPTTYLFRRNSATRKYHLGNELTEIQYSMGHEMTETLLPNSSLSDEETLHRMWLLEQQHPLNKLMNNYEPPIISNNTNVYKAIFDENNDKSIIIKGKELNDPIHINIECGNSIIYENAVYDTSLEYVNILTDMYDEYSIKNEAKWRSAKEIVNK